MDRWIREREAPAHGKKNIDGANADRYANNEKYSNIIRYTPYV